MNLEKEVFSEDFHLRLGTVIDVGALCPRNENVQTLQIVIFLIRVRSIKLTCFPPNESFRSASSFT